MPDHSRLDWGVVAVFVLVYLGMILGGLPRLKLNRSGVALLGAIAVMGMGAISANDAAKAVDLPTILLLFSFMVVSAQMRLGGFYTAVTRWVAALPLGRSGLLGVLIFVAGALSAVFSNDIVCLAMTPVVAQLCLQRRLPPVPFLVGLACAANIGSAATLIGNPQNMLIGAVLHLPFGGYVRQAALPVVVSLALLWAWLVWLPRTGAHDTAPPVVAGSIPQTMAPGLGPMQAPPFDAWQTAKGLTVARALLLVGSIANLIVVDLAQKSGVAIDWRVHVRIGAPVTLLTLGAVWLTLG